MVNCEQPGCNWQGFTSELAEHEYEVHGFGTWGGPDCTKCGGEGEFLASRVAKWNGEEDWVVCDRCRGRGFVA